MRGKAEAKDPAIVLFRNDLRLGDNRALAAAADSGLPVICVLVFDETSLGVRPLGGARRWWLHHSIDALRASLAKLGADLVLRRGPTNETVLDLQKQTGAGTVYWNRRYAPAESDVDKTMKSALRERGVKAEGFDGQLLHEPTLLKTGAGGSYKVFGAFRRALESGAEPRDPVDAPNKLSAWQGRLKSDALEDWGLLPTRPDWAGGLRKTWMPGEAGAQQRLDAFLEGRLEDYAAGRDFPAKEATSRLSPHLANGEITPYQILARLNRIRAQANAADVAKLRSELAWREFCYHLLFHFPALAEKNFNDSFDRFPWATPKKGLHAWQHGRIGYPIVDAGMRQLWQTGWMHNRIRMVVASFLTKHLLIDWRDGEQWFWDTLVDADPANNPGNWQWVAGCGADAAPYFRIFNPVLQGEKFDGDGAYTKCFAPELEKLDGKFVQKPWAAPEETLATAGVKLGGDYPVPLVDHDTARDRALAAYKVLKGD
ncbi:MAG: deoxyribodipyrimidine photo-lyase [Rhizobiaceae bacterium]